MPAFRQVLARGGAGLARAPRRGGRSAAEITAALARRPVAGGELPGARPPRRARCACCSAPTRARRLRRRAQVPDADLARPAARGRRRAARAQGARGARARRAHLPRDGARRPLRSARRRLPPLQRRRALVRAALREDALRPGSAPAHLRRGVAAQRRERRRSALAGARDRRVPAPRDARARRRLVFASQDADSEGEEGRFYVWTPASVRAVLGDAAAAFCEAYSVTERGNFEHGTTVLMDRARKPRAHSPPSASSCSLRAARAIAPGTDRKRVTAWNALRDLGARARGLAARRRRDARRRRRRRGLRRDAPRRRERATDADLERGPRARARLPRRSRRAARGEPRSVPRRRRRALPRARARARATRSPRASSTPARATCS